MYPEASTKTDEGECDIAKQGFMVTRGVEWGKSLGPEVFLCVE